MCVNQCYFIFCSLPNLSDDIRWSLDLRWQRPELPVGFYDLKAGVLMRTKENANMNIDWESFDNVDRHTAAVKEMTEDNFPVRGTVRYEIDHLCTREIDSDIQYRLY